MDGNSVATRAQALIQKRDELAVAANRDPRSIKLVGVSKGHSPELIRHAATAGIGTFAENYVQEWEAKREALSGLQVDWHFIGHLQTNKVKAVVGNFDLIHSADRPSLLNTIGRFAQDLGIEQDVLIEVNVAGESGKAGINPRAGKSLISEWDNIDGIRLCGLMLMPPPTLNPEDSRPYFQNARRWLDEWRPSRGDRHPWNELSMGTTQDFAIAIAEGATILRVGTALFGARDHGI